MDQIINNELIEIDNITCLEESVIVKRMMDYLSSSESDKNQSIALFLFGCLLFLFS